LSVDGLLGVDLLVKSSGITNGGDSSVSNDSEISAGVGNNGGLSGVDLLLEDGLSGIILWDNGLSGVHLWDNGLSGVHLWDDLDGGLGRVENVSVGQGSLLGGDDSLFLGDLSVDLIVVLVDGLLSSNNTDGSDESGAGQISQAAVTNWHNSCVQDSSIDGILGGDLLLLGNLVTEGDGGASSDESKNGDNLEHLEDWLV